MTNTNESGRSMVEMLGVLAIIGVLSVMGIAGYTQAMKKYRANEALSSISMAAMLCATGQASTTSISDLKGDYLTTLTCDSATGAVTYVVGNGVDQAQVEAALGASPYKIIS